MTALFGVETTPQAEDDLERLFEFLVARSETLEELDHERLTGEEAPIGLILPDGRQLAKTWPGSNFEISGSQKLPSTPPDLRSSAGALHEAIHRRVLPGAREAGTCLRQFFGIRWRDSVR